MAVSTLLMVLGIAVLRGLGPSSGRKLLGGLLLVTALGFAVKARGLTVGLTCALVQAMLFTTLLALAMPLWPRATRYVVPLGAVGLSLLWLGGA